MPQFEVRAPFSGYVRVRVEDFRVVRTLGKGYATVKPIDAEQER